MESGPQLFFIELFAILWKECMDGLHCWLLQWLSNEAPLCLHPYLIHAGTTISAKWKWGRKSNDLPVCHSCRDGRVVWQIKLHFIQKKESVLQSVMCRTRMNVLIQLSAIVLKNAMCSLKESLHCKVGIWNLKDDGMAFTGQTVLKKGAIKLHYGIILGTKGPDIPEHMRTTVEFLSQVS